MRYKCRGEEKTFDRDRLGGKEIFGMVLDVEDVKKYLLERNNKGEVNIELLTVIGTDVGAMVAINWAQADWNAPRLGTFKQGQDVKVLILLSPLQSYKGVTTKKSVAHPAVRSQLGMLIFAGTEAKHYRDAKQMYSMVDRFHRDPEVDDLKMVELDTALEGVRILTSPLGNGVANAMARFINDRLVKRQDRYPWSDRTSPSAP